MKKFKTFYGIGSFSSKKLQWIIKEEHFIEKLLKFNKNYLLWIYPDASRINSSNFNPIKFWKAGC